MPRRERVRRALLAGLLGAFVVLLPPGAAQAVDVSNTPGWSQNSWSRGEARTASGASPLEENARVHGAGRHGLGHATPGASDRTATIRASGGHSGPPTDDVWGTVPGPSLPLPVEIRLLVAAATGTAAATVSLTQPRTRAPPLFLV